MGESDSKCASGRVGCCSLRREREPRLGLYVTYTVIKGTPWPTLSYKDKISFNSDKDLKLSFLDAPLHVDECGGGFACAKPDTTREIYTFNTRGFWHGDSGIGTSINR